MGGATVEVAGPAEGAPEVSDADRFGGLAHRVPDVDAARERLTTAGFEVSPTRPGNKPRTRVCTVKSGTCGVPTLLLEPAAKR